MPEGKGRGPPVVPRSPSLPGIEPYTPWTPRPGPKTSAPRSKQGRELPSMSPAGPPPVAGPTHSWEEAVVLAKGASRWLPVATTGCSGPAEPEPPGHTGLAQDRGLEGRYPRPPGLLALPQPARTHLARGGVDELGVTVHRACHDQTAVLVAGHTRQGVLVAILAWGAGRRGMSSTRPPQRDLVSLKTHPPAATTLPSSASIPMARRSHLWGHGNPVPGSNATSPPRERSEPTGRGCSPIREHPR